MVGLAEFVPTFSVRAAPGNIGADWCVGAGKWKTDTLADGMIYADNLISSE
jgi:hypothetical protein